MSEEIIDQAPNLPSQENEPGHFDSLENLVLRGGGFKAAAYTGAYEWVYQHELMARIKRVAGSSSGAISATLIALGVTPDEFKTHLRAIKLNMLFNLRGEKSNPSAPFKKVRWSGLFHADKLYEHCQTLVQETTQTRAKETQNEPYNKVVIEKIESLNTDIAAIEATQKTYSELIGRTHYQTFERYMRSLLSYPATGKFDSEIEALENQIKDFLATLDIRERVDIQIAYAQSTEVDATKITAMLDTEIERLNEIVADISEVPGSPAAPDSSILSFLNTKKHLLDLKLAWTTPATLPLSPNQLEGERQKLLKRKQNLLDLDKIAGNGTAIPITFGHIAALREIMPEKVKELYITGTDTTNKNLEFYCAQHTPDEEVARAMSISSLIPKYSKALLHRGKHLVDGGIGDNFPIVYFLGNVKNRLTTLGFVPQNKQFMPLTGEKKLSFAMKFKNFWIKLLYGIDRKSYEQKKGVKLKAAIDSGDCEVINLPIGKKLGALSSNVDEKELDILHNNAYQACEQALGGKLEKKWVSLAGDSRLFKPAKKITISQHRSPKPIDNPVKNPENSQCS